MENFSTPRHQALVPRLVNLATVAVVLAATWWSNAQRPIDSPAEAALTTPTPELRVPAQQVRAAEPAPGATHVQRPAPTAVLPRDGLQAVGYQPVTRR